MKSMAIGILTSTFFMGCGTALPKARQNVPNMTESPIIRLYRSVEEEVSIPVPGQINVVEFLSEHCRACKRMSGNLDRLARKPSFQEVRFVGVVSGADLSKTQTLRKKHKVSFEWVPDPDGEIASYFAVKSVPTVLVIDQKGQIVLVTDGSPSDTNRILTTLRRHSLI